MTNEQIIFSASQQLAQDGHIKYTGRIFKAVDADGTEITIKETEAIHTYSTWKKLGFQVQKGQKAVARLTIWKHAVKVNEETGEETPRMFMKSSAFFSASQVEPAGTVDADEFAAALSA